MHLDRHLFAIDAAAMAARLSDFIHDRHTALHRAGAVVAFSGGLDSSTVLLLCVRALGVERVTALLLPERQGNPEAEHFARLVTGRFGIRTKTIDISPLLARLGTYDFVLSRFPSRTLQDWATRGYMRAAGDHPLLQIVHGRASALQRQGYAAFNSKHRVRAVVTYSFAEQANALVVGCAHKSEDMVGLFVKFGVDDCADVMPLKPLYRSQILQLAAHLGVPDEVLQRTPNPDIIPGVSDKYVDLLGLSSDTLDLVIYGLEHGLTDDVIASELQLPVGRVAEIRDLVQQTEHMRRPSQSPMGADVPPDQPGTTRS